MVRQCTGPKGVPYIATHDGRTIRYPDPMVKVNDSVQVEISSGKILDFIKFESGEFTIRDHCVLCDAETVALSCRVIGFMAAQILVISETCFSSCSSCFYTLVSRYE